MLVWAERQSIVGVIFDGIQRTGKSIGVPYDILYKWIGYANLIENRNNLINKRCTELTEFFHHQGLESCVLKGQGNSLMYPNPQWRTPGDIDVLIRGKGIREIIRIARKNNPSGKVCYHHVDYGAFNGVEVEVHYRPTFMNNLVANRRLQRWMKERENEQFRNHTNLQGQNGNVSVPTWEFNVVFQLSHIYRHVIQEGIGFRQLIDYYYLLKSNTNRSNNTNYYETLKYLGLLNIAGAVMYILRDILGLDEKYLIVPVDESRGRFLYEEIMRGGNFGMHDSTKKSKGKIGRNIERLKQDVRLVKFFPSECLWEPVFRLFHFCWRLKYS